MHFTKNPGIHPSINSLDNSISQSRQSDNFFHQKVIDSFIDGILIVSEQGDWIQSNDLAQRICEEITQNKSQPNSVPQAIWRVCQSLIESRQLYPNPSVMIESEIQTDKSRTFRIRVQWVELQEIPHSCLLVILEDRYQSLQSLVFAEIEKYGLTPREAEVWLLYRANYSRKEIAAELFISIDTVKKHLKNIKTKQDKFLCIEDWRKELVLN